MNNFKFSLRVAFSFFHRLIAFSYVVPLGVMID